MGQSLILTRLVLTTLLLVSQLIYSAVKTMTVIYDGEGESIAPYLADIQPVNKEGRPVNQSRPVQLGNPRLGALPVDTPELKPGKLPRSFIPKKMPNLVHPLVITGSDNLSLRWLQKNRRELKRLGALGILVQARNQKDLENTEKASGIQMSPVNGSGFVKAFGIRTYPVLVTMDGIYQ